MVKSNLYFFTATILEWKHALAPVEMKNIVLQSMRFLTEDNRVKVYAFVIMPNHIHVVWKIHPQIKKGDLKRDFLKYTGQQLKFEWTKKDPVFIENFVVRSRDRVYQIWERRSYWFELYKKETIQQKINYIHKNPVVEKWGLANEPEEYEWSSANFYATEKDPFGFLHHIGSWEEDFG